MLKFEDLKGYSIRINKSTNQQIDKSTKSTGELAQLARAIAWHAIGQGFDSPILHRKKQVRGKRRIQTIIKNRRLERPDPDSYRDAKDSDSPGRSLNPDVNTGKANGKKKEPDFLSV